MKKLFLLLLPALGLAIPAPARAAETTITYTGTITDTPDPSQAFGLKKGDPVFFSVTYDPTKLIDRTGTGVFLDANTGQPVDLPNIYTASLADDPDSAFSETIGTHTFTESDDLRFGTDLGAGAGNFPLAIFQGSTFVGVSFFAQADDGFVTLQDPISVALNYLPTFGIGGDNNSDDPRYGFLITTNLPAIQIASAVPEATTWTMTILGMGTIGYAMRRRRMSITRVSSVLGFRGLSSDWRVSIRRGIVKAVGEARVIGLSVLANRSGLFLDALSFDLRRGGQAGRNSLPTRPSPLP